VNAGGGVGGTVVTAALPVADTAPVVSVCDANNLAPFGCGVDSVQRHELIPFALFELATAVQSTLLLLSRTVTLAPVTACPAAVTPSEVIVGGLRGA
jgi:hypothetical protein